MRTIYDYSKLLGLVKEKGLTQEAFAHGIGISPATLSQKINNRASFKQDEIRKACDMLMIQPDSLTEYFFKQKV